jgi:hypothetical protein
VTLQKRAGPVQGGVDIPHHPGVERREVPIVVFAHARMEVGRFHGQNLDGATLEGEPGSGTSQTQETTNPAAAGSALNDWQE